MQTIKQSNNLSTHRYLRVRRTWIDVSCVASRREGILLYRPGRKWLRIVPWLMSKFAFLPWPSKAGWNDILPDFDLELAINQTILHLLRVDYVTIYTGNNSPRSKFTLLARVENVERVERLVIKVGRTMGAKAAIEQEYAALEKLQASVLKDQTPKPMGKGQQGDWTWSAQSVLPKGPSPNAMQQEHEDFLAALKEIGLTHGDFAPWNCAIVGGKLVAWDWEDAGPWVEGKDAAWFKNQVKTLLGC